MIKQTPGLIELSDTKKHCDYLLIEVSPGCWKIRINQYGNDWDESKLKVEDLEIFQEDNDSKAIDVFMKKVNLLLQLKREGK